MSYLLKLKYSRLVSVFVDGAGYADDGEEILGITEDQTDAKKRAARMMDDADTKLSKKARGIAQAGRQQAGAMMNFARTGVSEAKRKAVVVKEASKEQELDVDSMMDGSAQAMEVGPKASRGRPVTKVVQKRAPVATRNVSSWSNPAEAVDDYYANGDDDMEFDMQAPTDGFDAVKTELDAVEETQEKKISLGKTSRKLKVNFNDTKTSTGQSLGDVDNGFMPVLDGSTASGMTGVTSGTQQAMESTAAIDSKLWIKKPEDEDEYMNFFYLDANETNGVIYLFGKVEVTPAADPKAKFPPEKKYVSCCVAVHNCERNLFVLPRATGEFLPDGTEKRAEFQDVYGEINKLLVPSVIPKKVGASFRVAKKERNYAFEHGSIPRVPTDYMKVVYSSKFGVPSPAQCSGGKHYERIFGGPNSVLELFMLKRKLKGPCWLKIAKPRLMPEKLSWCKLEVGVENPKSIKVEESKMANPPLVAMSVSMKTAVNPITHTHEVISISGLVHTAIQGDVDTEVHPKHMRRFTYVRPLGMSCGSQWAAQFPHDLSDTIKKSGFNGILETFPNERAMLSKFFVRVQLEDPDIMASHNLFGFEFDVLLNRAITNKISQWDRLGRLRRSRAPKSINDSNAIAGRIFCDTYKASKEFLRETTYSLMHLAGSQLGRKRVEVDPVDVPRFFSSSKDIMNLYKHTENDTLLVQMLMLKLQVIPLTKQLTNLSGNLWSRTMRGARAERIEYLLLHEFHKNKFILPERKPFEKKGAPTGDDDGDDDGGNNKVGGFSHKRAKAAYAGGLVLEPKKGLYDTFILLLDFNSLYPSLIQEYNLCFTTVDYTKYMPDSTGKIAGADKKNVHVKMETDEAGLDGDEEDEAGGTQQLPPLPDAQLKQGILPRVIKYLVDRRKIVKNLLKQERDPVRRQEHDIRQKALKLTANSMYGCLGFSFSRFYARPIAALVTAKGREALQRTVDVATRQMQLDVIYGDTDSIMINTNSRDLAAVKLLGRQVTTEVNKLYKALELDIDGVFKSMLLLKKKKYAALTINERDGEIYYEKELKGLDLVRRDWAPVSKKTGRFVVDTILSTELDREGIVIAIHDYLADLANQIRDNKLDLAEFVVTKGLNKNPKDYPDVKGQAHLQVALQMLKDSRPVNIGDHIPYVICKEGPEGASAPQRAHHPDEVFRSNGALTVDFEWYLTNQILPPINRLCEPIDGTSQAAISEKLGLDSSKFRTSSSRDDDGFDDWDYKPMHMRDDSERFKGVEKLTYSCKSCHNNDICYPGTFNDKDMSGLSCTQCGALYLGRNTYADCYSYLCNRVTLLVRSCAKTYYDNWVVCDNPYCKARTKQQSLRGDVCMADGCKGQGHMIPEYDGMRLHTQLKYLESLFDFERSIEKKIRATKSKEQDIREEQVVIRDNDKKTFNSGLHLKDQETMRLLKTHMENSIKWSGYNWIEPQLWTDIFKKVLTNNSN